MCDKQGLTQQYDDTDQDGNDGPSAQTSSHDPLHVHTVSMVITLAHLDPQQGRVGHGQVSRVCDGDGDLIEAAGQRAESQPKLGVLT